VKTWAEAKTVPQRHEAVRGALEFTRGDVQRAAALLGISRRYLTRLLTENRSLYETAVLSRLGATRGTGETSVLSENSGAGENVGGGGAGETINRSHALTYGRTDPTFAPMEGAATPTEVGGDDERDEPKVPLSGVSLAETCSDWLDMESVRRYHASGRVGKPSKARVLEDLIRAQMDRDRQGRGR
jgi:hypothetical protein